MNMRSLILIIVLQTFALSALSQQNNKDNRPSVWLQANNRINIASIVFGDNQADVSFENNNFINEPAIISGNIYAVDENGIKYKAHDFKGVTKNADETTYRQTSALFTVSFDSLPKTTKYFDIVSDDRFSFFGITPTKEQHLVIPNAIGCVDSSEIAEELYYSQPTVITGHIGTKDIDKKMIFLILDDVVDGILVNNKSTIIDDDGSFKLNFEVDHPLWTCLAYDNYGKNVIAPVYIHPGDSLEINIDNENCSYKNVTGRQTCEKLMNYYPGSYIVWVDTLVDKMTKDVFTKMLSDKENFANKLADYICWKHSFSPWEVYLYKQQIQLNFTAYLLRYNVVLDANRNRREHSHLNTEQSDYSFLSRMTPNAISYCSLSFYYPILCQLQNIEEFSKIRSWGMQSLNYGEGMEAGIKCKQNDWINEKAGWENGLSYLMQGAMVVGLKNRIHSSNAENVNKENKKLLQLFNHPYFINNANRQIVFQTTQMKQ